MDVRPFAVGRRQRYRVCWTVCLGLAAWTASLAGCTTQQARLQSEDEEPTRDKYEVRTIRDVGTFDYAEPTVVAGVGLVTGLNNTGGSAPEGDYRTMLERQLLKQGVHNVKDVLARKDVSLVLVSAALPAGIHKGDPVDIEVSLPPGSKTTSLRGGTLEKCVLYNYDLARNLAPTVARNSNNAVLGHPIVEAEGHLLVGLGDGEESTRVKQGRIWGGGKSKIDRPLMLVLGDNKRFASVAKLVADRVNQTFPTATGAGLGQEVAVAKNDTFLVINVPSRYRLNLPRFMRVVGLIPLREGEGARPGKGPGTLAARETSGPTSGGEAGRNYRLRLEEELLDPATAVTAALRLEALGDSSRPALKRGLRSDCSLVRFACAESLAYLGDSSCGQDLGKLIALQPALRAFGLTALASLDEAISQDTLLELLESPAAETRYGAFRALRALNDQEPAVRGEYLNDSFWLHRVAPGTPALVHVCSTRRAEIVLFGDDAMLRPPFSLQAGEFNVTASEEDTQCTLGRFTPRARVPQHRQSSLRVEDLIRQLAAMGASYPEVVEVLRQAKKSECVSCAVEADAMPQATSVYALRKAGRAAGGAADDGVLSAERSPDTDEEVLTNRLDLGSTPELFDKGGVNRARGPEVGLLRDGGVSRRAAEGPARDGKSAGDKSAGGKSGEGQTTPGKSTGTAAARPSGAKAFDDDE